MKFKLFTGLLTVGFVLPVQAFSVKNQLASKTVTLSNFVYTVGSFSTPIHRTVVVNPGKTWASEQLEGSTGACTAVAGQKSFNLSGLTSSSIVTFDEGADGKPTYSISGGN